ncbi:MAG: hypothetical protein HPY54_00065 [Chthonomonadetes bacterium]|nr:hypothetical protein [Chthonomonadetes bacterium]
MQKYLFYPPLMALCLVLCLLLTPLQAQELSITLLNGDCDGDNEVTLSDFGILVAAFGSVPGDPNWDPRADLDGDLEVTLYDFSILQRNFGAIGAEPFDPALPRQPAPASGYAVSGLIELQDWEGAPLPVQLEALCEGDSQQVVYTPTQALSTGQPFTMFLPRSGEWKFYVKVPYFGLAVKTRFNRIYSPGDPIRIIAKHPADGETFADPSLGLDGPATVLLWVVPVDYDDVTIAGGSPRLQFPTNRERSGHLQYEWRLITGRGTLIPLGIPPFFLYHGALFNPAGLPPDQNEEEVRVLCTIKDMNPDISRRDPDKSEEIRFVMVRRPTLHIRVEAYPEPESGTPIASSHDTPVYIRFIATARRSPLWSLRDSDVQWQTPWGSFNGLQVVTGPIPRDEVHRRFEFSATAKFRYEPVPPLQPDAQDDTRRASHVLGFRVTDYDEQIDPSRGARGDEPSNWFDNRPGHWGSLIPRFNDTDNAGRPIVYFASEPFEELKSANPLAYLDITGRFGEQPFHEQYRGRIYLFESRLLYGTYKDSPQRNLALTASWLDLVAVTIMHEFSHRDRFIESWGGFSDRDIVEGVWSPPGEPNWKFKNRNLDSDLDLLSNQFERTYNKKYHCHFDDRYSVWKWWAGYVSYGRDWFGDDEIIATLWGEWGDGSPSYLIGQLDTQDWSVGGRQDFIQNIR